MIYIPPDEEEDRAWTVEEISAWLAEQRMAHRIVDVTAPSPSAGS